LSNLKVDLNSLGPVRKNRRMTLAPCEVRIQQKLQEITDTYGSGAKNSEEFAAALGRAAKEDYWFFLRVILRYEFLDPWDHGEEIVHFMQSNLGDPQMIMVPRGGIKTGCITIPYMPWAIAKDPTLRGILTNARDNRAQHFAREAANIITSPMYQTAFPYVQPGTKWGEKGYYVKGVSVDGDETLGRVDPSIGVYGLGGNITGSHVRAILHDDLINEDIARSAIELERADSFFKESLNCLDPGGQMFVVCTRWRYNDFYGKIESGEYECSGKRFKVFKRGALRTVLDDNGQPVEELFNPHRVYFDVNKNRQEVGYTEDFLRSMKKIHGSMYWALYQNDPLGDVDREFAIDQVREFIRFPVDLSNSVRAGIEAEGGATAFYSTFCQTMRDEGRRTPIEKLRAPRGQDKHSKIRAVVGQLIENGQLYIREDIWNRPGGLGQEIREFDRGDDDALDALCICIERAPKNSLGKPPIPYVGVDPAFTAEKHSDHTAIVVGCWYGEDFYVLDCHKFKAQKIDLITRNIMRLIDKYAFNANAATAPIRSKSRVRPLITDGNEPRQRQRNPFPNIWGNGNYKENKEDFDA
jgi:hypothetical protein